MPLLTSQREATAVPLIRETLPKSRWRPTFSPAAIIVAAVAIGFVFRLTALLSTRSLWVDESMLALNFMDRSAASLLQPLDFDQAAPLPFLLLEKLAVSIAGPSERVLRFEPFVVSLLALLLFPFVARRILKPRAAVFSTILFAVSPGLIQYSAEVKQYAGDVLGIIALLTVVVWHMPVRGDDDLPAEPSVPLVPLALVGSAVIWWSHPSLFMLASIGLVLGVSAVMQRNWNRVGRLLLVAAAWVASFGLHYQLLLKQTLGNDYLVNFWTEYQGFLPLNGEAIGWTYRAVLRLFDNAAMFRCADLPIGPLAGLLWVMGVILLGRRRPGLTLMLTLPIGLALLASGFKRYPFYGRLILFTIPLTVLALGAACSAVSRLRGAGPPPTGSMIAVVPMVFVLMAGSQSLQRFASRYQLEESRSLIEHLAENARPGDAVFVTYLSRPAFLYYTRTLNIDTTQWQVEIAPMHAGVWNEVAGSAEKVRGVKRVWLFDSHAEGKDNEFPRWVLGRDATCVDLKTAPGASLRLFERD